MIISRTAKFAEKDVFSDCHQDVILWQNALKIGV